MVSTAITINNVVLICLRCWLCFTAAVIAVSARWRDLRLKADSSVPPAQNSDLIIDQMGTDEAAVESDEACHTQPKFDEKRGHTSVLLCMHSFIFHFCISQQWYDHYLQWNQSEYPAVKNLRFTPDQVWTPDILLYNRCGAHAHGRALLAVVEPETSLCCSPAALMTSSMPHSRPTCWWTPVATVNICLLVGSGEPFPSTTAIASDVPSPVNISRDIYQHV